jgi:hypothetical protein
VTHPLARRTLAALVSVATAWALVACAPRAVNEITDATPIVNIAAPRFAVDTGATRIERFDPPGAGAGVELTVGAQVTNPNDFAVTVERVDWTLRLAGRPVASGQLPAALRVPARATVPLAWSVEASLADSRDLWAPVVGAYAGRPLPFEVEGRLRFVSEVYAFTTGVRPLFAGVVVARESVRPPELSPIEGAHEVVAVRADAPVVRLAVRVTNPGDVGYFLTGRGLRLMLGVPRTAPGDENRAPTPAELADGLAVGEIDLAPVPVPAGATVRTDLLIYIDPASLAPAARHRLEAAIAGTATPFALTGAWSYDVLGVDSFPVSGDPVLVGVLFDPATAP